MQRAVWTRVLQLFARRGDLWCAENAGRPAAVRPLWGADATDRLSPPTADSIHRILAYFGEPSQTPRIALVARGPPRGEDFDRPKAICPPGANPCLRLSWTSE